MEDNCCLEKCDIFDFMSNYVGLSVLHPGGFDATRKLAEACGINEKTKVVDIACGKGTTSVFLAKNYGCSVTGVDILPGSIDEANAYVKKKGLDGRVNFQVADALNLPFDDSQFDVAISQAILVLINDKNTAIREAMRVIKPGGAAGWLELSWQKEPTEEFLKVISDEICAACMLNVSTFEGWEKLFKESGVNRMDTIKFRNSPKGTFSHVLKDEGPASTAKIMLKYATNPKVRARMKKLDDFFMSDREYIGYGIYIARK